MKEFDKLFSRMSKHAQDRGGTAGSKPSKKGEDSSESRMLPQVNGEFWIDIAAAVWKLRQKITDPVTHETKEEMRPLMRYVDSIWEALSTAGLDIQDHTNQPFDSGQSLEVLAFQPTPGTTKEFVSETVKPTIYLKGHRLQMGQVIVATPENPQSGSGGTCLV